MSVSTVGPGKDYTTLTAWEAAEQRDLTASGGDTEEAEVYAYNDTTAFTIDGWTTSATDYIRIYAASGEGHSGFWDTAKFYASASVTICTVLEEFVRFEGLQFQLTSTANELTCIKVGEISATSEVRIERCLFKGIVSTASGGNSSGVYTRDSVDGNCVVVVINCVAFDFFNSDFPNATSNAGFFNQWGDMRLYNCTAYKCATGFRVLSTTWKATAVNCIADCDRHNTNRIDFSDSARFQNSSHNASTDATAPDSGSPSTSLLNLTAGDLDWLSETETDTDFLAIDSTSVLVGAGTDDPLSGVYSDDVRGTTRTSAWDIGADEHVAGTTQTLTLSLDAALQKQQALTASLNAALQKERGADVGLTVALQAGKSEAAVLEAALQQARTRTASLNLAIQADGVATTADLTAALQAQQLLTASLDASLLSAESLTASLDLAAQANRIATLSLNANLTAVTGVVTSLQAALQTTASIQTGISVALQSADRTQQASLNAALARAQQISVTCNAALATAASVSMGLQAVLSSTIELGAGLSANIISSEAPAFRRRASRTVAAQSDRRVTCPAPGRLITVPPSRRRH